MPDCRYCDRTFGDEDAYLDHLEGEHADELGRLDRRRVEDRGSDGLDIDAAPVALLVVLGVAAAIVAYVVFFTGGGAGGTAGAATTPSGLGTVHVHGTIDVVIDGQRIDFSQARYQLQADAFHFEAGEGSRWHVHARDVTLKWAMGTVGIGVSENAVTFDGETYRDGDPDTTVIVEINGEPVDPATYVLRDGDSVRIAVRVG